MSLINQIQPAKSAPEYAFASGNINDFMTDFGAPVQQTGVDEMNDLNEFEERMMDEQPEPAPERLCENPQVSKATGRLLTIMTDTSISALLAFAVAKDGDVQAYKATPEERDELENAFTEYTKLKGTDIPPGMALLMAISVIYGAKVPKAFATRKHQTDKNNENEK